ncbi:lipoprotein LprG [Pedococcus dokdonensis]|uniref:Lipoprotein LprG n=1 Tax=Pedococcus dokdonensis TaxID=443156 RepID=A0A1H0T7B7_9MICO|nr:LppX_LprAFG lipoprotein [Pedococcus dokdonensis]SDP49366.1 lipoprotein LprG [Pedococcus dokdonensis]
MRLKGIAIAGTAVLVALTLVGCSKDKEAPAKEGTPAEQLAAARTNLEKSPAVTFTLNATGLPSKAIGVSAAKGTGLFTPPSFKGTLNATVGGVTGTVDVIAVEQDVYMKFFTPGYNKIDPKTYGAPNPAQLFDTQTGITSLIGKTQAPARAGQVRDGSEVLTTFTGKVPGDAVADLFVIGVRSGTFDVTYGVTTEKQLRTVVLKGPFYEGSTSTYNLRLTSLATPVAITRP